MEEMQDNCDNRIFAQGVYLSEVKLAAEVMTSSWDWTRTGIFRQPGDFRTRMSSFIVSWRTLEGHMSIFVTTTNTGTLRARARPRCSMCVCVCVVWMGG